MDTQLLRNAYMGRPVEDIDMPFGKFACLYLNVDDPILYNLHRVNPACDYIIAMGYNKGSPDAWRQWSTKWHDWEYATSREELRPDVEADPLYLKHEGLSCPATLSEPHATTEKAG